MVAHSGEQFLSAGEYLAVVRDFALSKGISPAQLLENSQVQWRDLIHPPELVNNLIVNRVGINLFSYLEQPVADACEFGLRMTAASHGALGLAVQYADNLNEAYEILRHFYNTRINSQDVQIEESGAHIRVFLVNKYQDNAVGPDVQQFFDLATLVSIATNTFHALDNTQLEGNILLRINAPRPQVFPDLSQHGVRVEFDQAELELRLPASWKYAPLRASNPAVVEAALETCEQELKRLAPNDWLEQVRQFLLRNIAAMPSLNEIACEFCMSAATFKRRLAEYQVSYSDIKNELRLEQASSLLVQPGQTVESVAEKLGFSDASNFTKAFKTWTGKTPRQYAEPAQGQKEAGA